MKLRNNNKTGTNTQASSKYRDRIPELVFPDFQSCELLRHFPEINIFRQLIR